MTESSKTSALIVDDEPDQRLMIRNLLARHADVEIVGDCVNGYEAIEAIKEHTPDLIFLDVHMPEIDGFSVLDGIEEMAGHTREYRGLRATLELDICTWLKALAAA